MTDKPIDTASLGSMNVVDEDNGQVLLSSFWQEKTAVLVFVRHFG